MPPWYQTKLEGLLARVEDALEPLLDAPDAQARRRTARVLWAGVHGITSLATTDKLSVVTTDAAPALVDDLVSVYLKGLPETQSELTE